MVNFVSYKLSKIPNLVNYILNNLPNNDDKYYDIVDYNISTHNDRNYLIVKYNKHLLHQELIKKYGLLRSVIVSNSRVACFSPPKAISADKFITKYPNPKNTDDIVAEEFVEGTMINLFYDVRFNSWEIATRNTVGAEISFGTDTTFRQMFLEACFVNNLVFETLNKKCCYSFVLQHPKNRIVVPINTINLYLIAVYELNHTSSDIIINEFDISNVKSFEQTNVKVPKNYIFETYGNLIEQYASRNTPYDVMGVIIKNKKTGERAKIRNPNYEEVRNLRGNNPKLLYQYLCLRKQGKVAEFLKFYPEMKSQLSELRDQIHLYTDNLHKNYVECYVKKKKGINDYGRNYKQHMIQLHKHFIDNLRPIKQFINITEVIKYVNDLHPSVFMYCLNHNIRKKIIDDTKADTQL